MKTIFEDTMRWSLGFRFDNFSWTIIYTEHCSCGSSLSYVDQRWSLVYQGVVKTYDCYELQSQYKTHNPTTIQKSTGSVIHFIHSPCAYCDFIEYKNDQRFYFCWWIRKIGRIRRHRDETFTKQWTLICTTAVITLNERFFVNHHPHQQRLGCL